MSDILSSLLTGRNEFASGGLLLMIIGVVSVWLRAVPEYVWSWLVCQTTMTVTVSDDDAAFRWVKEWFLEQKFVLRVRRVDLDTTVRNERIAMIPAPGKHWFWYCGRPFRVWFSRTENSRERSGRRLESLTFRTVGRNRAVLQRFVDDVVLCHVKRQGVQSYLYLYNDGWDDMEGYSPRMLDSVILQPGEKEHLLEDMARFRESKSRYELLGVPYHRGYLFYGPPGTGKTSLVSALAGDCGVSIYTLNLTEFNDRSLAAAVGQVPSDSILLFEDIDCMRGSQSRPPARESADDEARGVKESAVAQNGVTLSGLLNVLDGFLAPSGVMFVRPRIELSIWIRRSCVREGSITNCTWGRPASTKNWNCTAGSSEARQSAMRASLWMLSQPRPWLSFRARSWRWNRASNGSWWRPTFEEIAHSNSPVNRKEGSVEDRAHHRAGAGS